jgi:Protein of unknown function (DUF3237)
MTRLSTRRDFARFSLATAAGMTGAPLPSSAAETEELRSQFLFDLALTAQPPAEISSDRMVVAVSSGTFEGPRLKGTIIGPAGDWMVKRPDGSRVLDVRTLFQTDDSQRIYMTCRGIAYTPPGGALYARIQPMFETGAAKYAWLNNIIAVGVYRPVPGKIVYRVYEIL